MESNSTIFIFIDDETKPIAEFKSPVNFELDTTKLVDGAHTLKIVSKGSDGVEGIRLVPFEVRNGPAISIEGIRENAVVDGILPLMINAYSKGNSKEFNIIGSETPHSIPSWVWILIIGFFGWALYYLFMYIHLKQ
ncbi:MAG TPA: cytochrome C [Arachidicoccus soli]|uniref:Cytochrome C n=1 Tax=Arachidicoccus soli TaxID=2341117 RepID=A0A386HMZ1_9BACT|nr:cytochrome C [Arachidicoccus soli]AYD47113.1 cytochrome C [Arachidicoccus soli]HEU0226228.1 cytochrome C [Arachidicoccus soli]